MQPSHLHDDDSAPNPDNGSKQSIVPQGTYWRLLTPALSVIQNVYHSATRPPTPSPDMVSEGYEESCDGVERSPTFPGAYPFEPYKPTNARPPGVGERSGNQGQDTQPIDEVTANPSQTTAACNSESPFPKPFIPPDPGLHIFAPSTLQASTTPLDTQSISSGVSAFNFKSTKPSTSTAFAQPAMLGESSSPSRETVCPSEASRALPPAARAMASLSTDSSSRAPQVTEQPYTSTLQGAHHFRIDGSHFAHAGRDMHTVNYYNSISNLDKLEPFVSFNALHDSSAQDPERRCHPGTRETVLKLMRNWVDDPEATQPILWLHGPAGVGKSAIAQTIAHSYRRDKVAATFFFFRSDSYRNDGNRLFPTLAWQLAVSIPQVKDPMAQCLTETPDLPRKAIEIQFEKLLAGPLQAMAKLVPQGHDQTWIVIVDGLDECSEEKLQQRFLKVIGKSVADRLFPLRFLVSSRPEALIQDAFRPFLSTTLRIDLADIDGWYQDVEKYLKEEFTRIASEQKLDSFAWPGDGIIHDFVSKSCGQFVYASTIIKFVGDEYSAAASQLKIVLGLKASKGTSPFAELDALYFEILRRQHDPDFLMDLLALLVARTGTLVKPGSNELAEDDALLLNVEKDELHRKLRGMHSVLKFEPLIDFHHRSFLDFIRDQSRSYKYHINEKNGARRYLELIVSAVTRHASRATNDHQHESFSPAFNDLVWFHPPRIKLPLQDWEEALRPLLSFQDSLLESPNLCPSWTHQTYISGPSLGFFGDIQLQLALLRITHAIPACQPDFQNGLHSFQSNGVLQGEIEGEGIFISFIHNSTAKIRDVAECDHQQQSPAPGAQNIPNMALDACLYSLLANLRNMTVCDIEKAPLNFWQPDPSKTMAALNLLRSLLYFDPAETSSKIRSHSDAQILYDLVFHLIKNESLLVSEYCGAVAMHNARRLAKEIYARIPLFPRSLFLNGADVRIGSIDQTKGQYHGKMVKFLSPSWPFIEDKAQEILAWATLLHENICPLLGVFEKESKLFFAYAHGENGTLREWRHTSNPSVGDVLGRLIEVAKAIHHMHLSGLYLHGRIEGDAIIVDSKSCARIPGCGVFLRRGAYQCLELDVKMFGKLFYEIYFDVDTRHKYGAEKGKIITNRPGKPEIHDGAWELIQRCCAEDEESRPTMNEVVEEMEGWKLASGK